MLHVYKSILILFFLFLYKLHFIYRIKIQPKYAFGAKGNESFKVPANSTIEYIVKLIDCGKGLEEWKLSDNERVAEAKVYKEKGTNYFKKENYELAIKMYNKCKNLLPSIKDNTSDEVKALKVATHSNIALSHQKSNNHFEAKQEVNIKTFPYLTYLYSILIFSVILCLSLMLIMLKPYIAVDSVI